MVDGGANTRSTASSSPPASRSAPAYTRRAGFEIYGRGGLTLTDYWADGMKTLHGFHSHGFPNCFRPPQPTSP